MLCALLLGGCAECRLPRIDPSGDRLFAPAPEPAHPKFKNEPGAPRPWDMVEVLLVPRTTVAPVGSEVILLAGVRGPDPYLRTNERVQWSIAPGDVGEFVDVDGGSCTDMLVGDFTRPHKVNSTFAVGTTSRRYLRLTRGTPTPTDDVTVLRGQTWISVTSPVEGTSHVTAYAPHVFGWELRKQTATVHWIDAQWRFPPPTINPAGSRHALATMVMRRSDQSPCVGWRVLYTIVDGPPAGFAPGGSPTAEVETDASGQATAEIFQQQPSPGTNRVSIQVIRPPLAGGPSGTRLVVGTGFTSATWSAPGISLRKTGPAAASVGAILTYRIELANAGDMAADGVVVTDDIPDSLSLMSSNPQGQFTGRAVQWQIGRLGPGERRVIDVSYRADRQGNVTTCAEAVAAGGLRAKECVTTAISLAVPQTAPAPGAGCTGPATTVPPLDVRILGPDRASVGDRVTFEIVITNRGATTATGLVIKDRFDSGLVHESLRSPIKKLLGEDLPPGQSKRVGIEFRVAQAGRLCQTAEVTGNGGIVASAEACLTATGQGGFGGPPASTTPGPTAPGPTTPGTTIPGPTTPSTTTPGVTPPAATTGRMSLKVTGPQSASVGQDVDFFIEVSNDGFQPLTNLKVISDFDESVNPTFTSEKDYRFEGRAIAFTMASLSPGQKKKYQIRCNCEKASSRACVRVKATAAEATPASQEACLAIRAAAAPSTAGLSITVGSLYGAIAEGKELTYVISVTNSSKTEDGQVVLKVTVPPEMIPSLLATYGPARPKVQGQIMEFAPVERIAAGETLTYRIRVQAKKAGDVRVKAEVTSRAQPQPVLAEARTTILPGGV